MWIFARYGFYSIACAQKRDGTLDANTVMIRARMMGHLKNLQERFSGLGDAEIVTLPQSDYRYRLIVPKSTWSKIIAELAEEQEWSNFKDEAKRFQGTAGSEYIHALHEVWGIMDGLQEKGERRQSAPRRSL